MASQQVLIKPQNVSKEVAVNHSGEINRLVLAVVSGLQADNLMRQLTQNGFYFTKVDSWGGMLQEPAVCLLVGVPAARLEKLLEVIRACCQPYRQYVPAQIAAQPDAVALSAMVEAQMGGAVVYTMIVERFAQL